MCRWKALVIFIGLCNHLAAQPIANIDNDRSTRQLDFGECCPCNKIDDTIEGYDGLYDIVGTGSERTFSRPRDFDDCPCRDLDSQGASSVFFPNTLRSAGTFSRSDDKKENLKPLFNPEVDLAASVLETLREVTDEEYQDALVRDAAKSAAKDDFLFGDATPEESANILAVVVQPKFAASNEDIVPEVLHSQKSRCIHPLDSSRSVSKQVLPQSRFSLDKLFFKNVDDADSNVGASNVHEQIVPANIDTNYLRAVTNDTSLASISSENKYCNVGKSPNFRSARLRNNLKNFTRSNLLQTIRENSKILGIPSIKSRKLLPEKSESNNGDLNPAASEHELVETKMPYFRNKPDWLNIKENSGPLSLKNLLNLKDVELIPLKELHSNQSKGAKNKKPKLILPSMLRRDAIQATPKYDIAESDGNNDHNRDPETVNTNCYDERIIESESNEGLSKQKSTSNNLKTEKNALIDSLDKELNNKPIIHSADDDLIGTENDDKEDSLSGASNNINEIVENPMTFANSSTEQYLKNIQSSDIFHQKEPSGLGTEVFETNPKIIFFEPISIDKTLSTIRENFDKNLEDLKYMRNSIKSKNIGDKINIPVLGSINHEKECDIRNNEFDIEEPTDRVNEVTIFDSNLSEGNLVGSEKLQKLQSHTLGDDLGDRSEYGSGTRVSEKNLQKLSNSLFQQEEQDLDTTNTDQMQYEQMKNDTDTETNLSRSNNLQFKSVVEPTAIDNFNEDNTCDFSVASSRSSPIDDSVEVTTGATNIISKEDETVRLQPSSIDLTYLPTINPLPAVDDIKVKLDNLLDKITDTNIMSLEVSNNAKDETVMEVNKLHNLQRLNFEEYNNETNPNDQNIDASETVINSVPKYDDNFLSKIQQPQLNFLKQPLPNNNDVLNVVPHKTLIDDLKVKLNHLFDKSEISLNRKSNSINAHMVDSEKYDNFNGKHVEHNFESELLTPNAPLINSADTDVGARDMATITDAENQDDDVSSALPIFQSQASIQKESSPDLNDLINTITPKVTPKLDDLNLKLTNLFKNNDREINTSEKVISEENNLSNYRNFKSSEEDSCKITLAKPPSSEIDNNDPDVGASETMHKIVPKNDDKLGLKSILQPSANFSNKINSLALESLLGDMKVEPSNLLDRTDRNIEINPLESLIPKLNSNTPDLRNPVMATDASTSSLQTLIPSSSLLGNSNLNIWELTPQKSASKSKLPKEIRLRPLNDELLGTMPLFPKKIVTKNGNSKFRSNQNSPSILRFPFDMKQSLSNPDPKFTDPHNKAKEKHDFSTLFRNLERPLEYSFQQLPKNSLKPLKKQLTSSSNILDRIAKNHEDFNDKIRNLHTDFNDRIKSVRKDIFDRSKSPVKAKSPKTKDLFISSSNLRNQNKPIQRLNDIKAASSESESTKFTNSLKSKTPKPIKRISLPKIESKKFRMPTAASILVPKTVKIPELKPTLSKPPPLPLLRESTTSPWYTDQPDTKQLSESPKTLTNNLRDWRKPYTSKRKATVKVSFSSTPLPFVSTEYKPLLKAYNTFSPDKLSINDINENTRKASPIEISDGESNTMGSWPNARDTSFISRVKDAVQSKLTMGSPTNLKQSRILTDDTKTSLGTDMSQAASEPENINDMSLRENVSYKCKMVCTKE